MSTSVDLKKNNLEPLTLDQLGKVIEQLLTPDFISYEIYKGQAILKTYSAAIVRILTVLSNHHLCAFTQLVDITAIDYPARQQRFEVVYNLLSITCNQRLRIKIDIDENTPVPSVSNIFVNSTWYEREVWDLFGIVFSDQSDLRRILTDYNFSGHPLRKDFPLSGYTQVRYSEEEQKVIYEPVKLNQDYRNFDFQSPWEGMVNSIQKPTKLDVKENEKL